MCDLLIESPLHTGTWKNLRTPVLLNGGSELTLSAGRSGINGAEWDLLAYW